MFCGLTTDRAASTEVGFMVRTEFQYNKALKYPETVLGGLKVTKIGRSSVTYQFHIFQLKDSTSAACGESYDPFSKIGFQGQVYTEEENFNPTLLEKDFSSSSSAVGEAVHVFVDPLSQKPKSMSPALRAGLESLLPPTEACASKL